MANPFAVALRRSAAPAPVQSAAGGALVPAWQNKIPQWSRFSTRKAIEEGLKLSHWVYTCIDRLSKSAASVRWGAYEQTGDDEWELAPKHPLTLLMRRPNPFMSGRWFMRITAQQLFLAGNAMLKHITVSRFGRAPVELWPIWELDKIQVVPSQTSFIDRYDFRRDGEPIPIYPDEVTHLQFPDPGNPFWGLSPLQAASRIVDTDVEAVRWNKLLLQNRAVSDGVFSLPSINNQEDYELARQMVREQYSGADNARLPWVLGGQATYHQMSMTPAELDYLESRKFTVEEIGAVYGVPVPLILARDSTFANMDTARRVFWEDTVLPFLDDLKDAFNHSITPLFGGGDIELRYDTSSVSAMREDMTEKTNQLKALVSVGVPLNDAMQRLEMGLDSVEGGDVGFIPATMVPIETAGEPDDPATMAPLNRVTGAPMPGGKPQPDPNDPTAKPAPVDPTKPPAPKNGK